jgi:hypothetical protein
MKLNFSHKQTIAYTIAALLLIFALSLSMAYFTSSRDFITVTFKRIYPAAIVGSRVISINDMEEAKIVGARFGVNALDAEQKQINTEKSIILARHLNVRISNDQIADETLFYTKNNETEYKNLLHRYYDDSERLFYKFVVIPQVTDAHLRMKYNNDINNTSPAYKEALGILDKLSKGEKFEDLAKIHSADKASAQLGGDLGFYESGQLLPELEDQVSISATGEVRKDIIISRLGYHIIYPVEYSNSDGKKMWHVKHMLFPTEGYEQWLSMQLQNISYWRIQK